MSKFKIWQVGSGTPLKLAESNVGLEKNLEDWIEADPSLLPGELEIISRQMVVEGGRLDLLALDPTGRFVVIEIKPGALAVDVVTQAMYYAAQIDNYPFGTIVAKVHDYPGKNRKTLKNLLNERGLDEKDFENKSEVLIYLVGTQSTQGLNTMMDYMARKYHIPLTIVTFDVFQSGNGQRLLVRDITETDNSTRVLGKRPKKGSASIEKVCALADQTGIGKEFRLILEESIKLGLHQRPYAQSIMYTHPDHKVRMLFTVWAHQKPMKAYIGYEAFVEYYPVLNEQVEELLGSSGWRRLDLENTNHFISGLRELISRQLA